MTHNLRTRITVPDDLLLDIFSRVPAKSVARFHCVSKYWTSILGRQDFTELFLTNSSTRPRILFTFSDKKTLFLFSSRQPQNPEENSCLVATLHKSFPIHCPKTYPIQICPPLFGLFCLQNQEGKAGKIHNPVTGESITLPKVIVKTKGDDASAVSCFGFDPINKQFKVLCMTWFDGNGKGPYDTQVLTLDTKSLIWRMIQDPIVPHFPPIASETLCINGVLYYRCNYSIEDSGTIVCLNVTSEKFSFIDFGEDMFDETELVTLINYKGKLGVHHRFVYRNEEELALWVLEDAEKQKWSKTTCVLTPLWDKPNGADIFHVVGMTCASEIVFMTLNPNVYVFFYNFKSESFTSLYHTHTFLDYVESLKLM